jgi:hypothetical protein
VTAALPLVIRKYFISCSPERLVATVANVSLNPKSRHQIFLYDPLSGVISISKFDSTKILQESSKQGL